MTCTNLSTDTQEMANCTHVIMKKSDRGSEYVEEIKRELYETTVSLGGVIAGEQGIGKIRINFLDLS